MQTCFIRAGTPNYGPCASHIRSLSSREANSVSTCATSMVTLPPPSVSLPPSHRQLALWLRLAAPLAQRRPGDAASSPSGSGGVCGGTPSFVGSGGVLGDARADRSSAAPRSAVP